MQDKLVQLFGGLGRHCTVLIIGHMLILVVAGGIHVIRAASHYGGNSKVLNIQIPSGSQK